MIHIVTVKHSTDPTLQYRQDLTTSTSPVPHDRNEESSKNQTENHKNQDTNHDWIQAELDREIRSKGLSCVIRRVGAIVDIQNHQLTRTHVKIGQKTGPTAVVADQMALLHQVVGPVVFDSDDQWVG